MQTLAYFYYPTTAVIVDDDTDFLNSLKLALAPHCRSLLFTSPEQAKDFLVKDYQNYLELNPIHNDYEIFSDVQAKIDIPSIHKTVFNPDRFKQSIVAIVDYDMPTFNGLALARKIRAATPTKIIMLTGEADKNTAIDAFNKQEIDSFIIKNSESYLDKLLQCFSQLQHAWFAEQSKSLTDAFRSVKHHPSQDLDFIQLFDQICTNHQIVEYYLIDESCSFLMLDKTGRITWLITRTEEDMQTYYELAEDAPPAFLKLLQDRKKIANFSQIGDAIEPIDKWKIHDALQLKDKPIYYCVVPGKDGFSIDDKPILSYEEFLQKN